jgi:hypothetical protein
MRSSERSRSSRRASVPRTALAPADARAVPMGRQSDAPHVSGRPALFRGEGLRSRPEPQRLEAASSRSCR